MGDNLQGANLLQFLIESPADELRASLEDIHPADILDALEEYEGDTILLLSRFPSDVLAAIIEEAEDEDKGEILDLFPDEQKAEIISEMASDELVDLLETMHPDEASELLEALPDEDAQEVLELMRHHPETAGGIMATEFVAIREQMTVKETLEYLQVHGHDAESLSYLYVLDEDDILKGVIALREIVVSSFDEHIGPLINTNVISVRADMDQEEVSRVFAKYGFHSIPVVDENDRMLGIVTADDVFYVVEEETTEDMEKMAALAHSEKDYLDTGIFGLAKQRIFWLLFLMISATFTGVIIQGYQKELASVVILAAFIPMLMDTGGNAGTQVSTLVIRGMALGEIKLKDYFKVLYKELRVSLIVGVVLAVVNFLRVWIFHHDPMLALTVSAALLFTVVLAKLVGCTLPMIARKLKIDPALMASPIITTIVDALSLSVYLYLAKTIYINA
ncbi:MAG: magnesium transporter [Candidatus Cloacimonadaceae bacterium]|jgi:magnesium transporter